MTPAFPSYTSAHSTVSAAAAGVLAALFGDDYHFTVGAESVSYTRSFDSFGAAATEAGQSRIYGGIHYQFDNQAAQASGHALSRFVVANFLRPAEEEDEAASRHDNRTGGPRQDLPPQPFGDGADSHHDDHTGGRATFGVEGLALLLAGPGNASATSGSMFGAQQVSPTATGQPTELLAAASVGKDQPIQHAGAPDRLAARALTRRAVDQTLAGLDDGRFVGPLQGDVVLAWAR